jgi:hypothetical protein
MKIELSLRKEYCGLPIGMTIKKNCYFDKSSRSPYYATYELVSDSSRLTYRVGDIIRFSMSSFIFRKDIRGQYGTILIRYKIIKEKRYKTFIDYYAIVLINSGESKGKLYNVCPFNLCKMHKSI